MVKGLFKPCSRFNSCVRKVALVNHSAGIINSYTWLLTLAEVSGGPFEAVAFFVRVLAGLVRLNSGHVWSGHRKKTPYYSYF